MPAFTLFLALFVSLIALAESPKSSLSDSLLCDQADEDPPYKCLPDTINVREHERKEYLEYKPPKSDDFPITGIHDSIWINGEEKLSNIAPLLDMAFEQTHQPMSPFDCRHCHTLHGAQENRTHFISPELASNVSYDTYEKEAGACEFGPALQPQVISEWEERFKNRFGYRPIVSESE